MRRGLNSSQRIQRRGKIHHAQRRGRYAHRGQRLHPAGWRGHHPQAGAPPRQAICNTVNIPCGPFLVVRRPLILTSVIRFVLHRPDDLRAALRHLNAADKLGGHSLFLHGPAGRIPRPSSCGLFPLGRPQRPQPLTPQRLQVIADRDSLDWKDYDADTICKRVTSRVQPGSIVLFHNAALHTPEALPTILTCLINDGYTVVPISQLILEAPYTIDHTGRQFPAETTSAT